MPARIGDHSAVAAAFAGLLLSASTIADLPIAKSSLGVGITAFSVIMALIESTMFTLAPALEKARSAAISSDASVRGSCAEAGAAMTTKHANEIFLETIGVAPVHVHLSEIIWPRLA